MSFDTYANLQTEIATWAMRSGDTDFTTATPGFITLCEDMVNNGADGVPALRCREMESSASIALTAGSGTLPTDFLEYRSVKNAAGRPLTMRTPNGASVDYWQSTAAGSCEFDIKGSTIETYPADAGPLTLDYYAKVPALSVSNTSNWLLLKAPRVYLFGALVNAAPFMMDDERVATWATLYQKAIGGLVTSDLRARYSRATQHVRSATP